MIVEKMPECFVRMHCIRQHRKEKEDDYSALHSRTTLHTSVLYDGVTVLDSLEKDKINEEILYQLLFLLSVRNIK